MAAQKLTFENKQNVFPFTIRKNQATAEDFNEIKAKFNANVDELIYADDEDVETVVVGLSNVIKLKDRANTPHKGYKIIREDFPFWSPPADYDNSIWEIRYSHSVHGTDIEIPDNVTLFFNGGQIIDANSITGNNTRIDAGMVQIFDAALTPFLGTWIVDKVYPQWWGAVGDGVADDTTPIQCALNFGGLVYFANGTYSTSFVEVATYGTHVVLANKALIQSTMSVTTGILISADDCILEGGTFFMPPVFEGYNVEWDYAGILVTGSNVKIKGLTLYNVQKVGIGFKNTNNCFVENCIINGGFGSYGSVYDAGDVSHFGIAFDPDGTEGVYVAINNTINTCIQGIFLKNYGASADESGILITGNVIQNCYNHAINCDGGEGQVISNNQLFYCGQAIATKCNNGAVVNGNMILFGKTDTPLADEVGILLTDPINVICSGNNIIGNSRAGRAAVVLQSVDEVVISDNIVTDNILKLAYGVAADAIQLGNVLTTTLANNIISGNIIVSSCESGHGAVYVNAGPATCYNNIIEKNNITINVLDDNDSAIMVGLTVGGLTIRDNNIIIVGNSLSEINAYGINIIAASVFNGEILNNRISVFTGNGGNMNVVGVNIAGDNLIIVESNKLDASLSDAASYEIYVNVNANAILKKNVKDIRIPTSGTFTIPSGDLTTTLPDGNFEYLEVGATDYITNILIRPINPDAIDFMITHKITPSNFGGSAVVTVDVPAPSADLLFAWEII